VGVENFPFVMNGFLNSEGIPLAKKNKEGVSSFRKSRNLGRLGDYPYAGLSFADFIRG